MSKIAFLGAGNIAQAIMTGLQKSGFNRADIIAADPAAACRDRVQTLGIRTTQDNVEAVAQSDILMLCVKPDKMNKLLAEIADVAGGKLLVSVAAGITSQTLGEGIQRQHPEEPVPIVRCMPNTPALVQAGITAMFATEAVTASQRQAVENILSAVGATLWLEQEADLNLVTAVSGSGPAYFFLLMEAMLNAAVNAGLPTDISRQLVLQTALGSAKIALHETGALRDLRRRVTSPGGTTQAAMDKLMAAGFEEMVGQAIQAAAARAAELSGASDSKSPDSKSFDTKAAHNEVLHNKTLRNKTFHNKTLRNKRSNNEEAD